MKTLLLFLAVSFSLTACQPRDPEVLSEADKNHRSRPSNKGGENREIRASLPKNLELFMAEVVEARQAQISNLLKLALGLASSTEKVTESDCVAIHKVKSTKEKIQFKLAPTSKCQKQTEQLDFSIKGNSDLLVSLDEQGQVTEIEYKPKLTAATSVIQKKGKSQKKMTVKDELSFKMVRVDDSFEVTEWNSLTETTIQDGKKRDQVIVEMLLEEASFSLEGKALQLSVVAEAEAEAMTTNGAKTPFILSLTSLPDAFEKFDYTFQFADGNPRSGTIKFEDKEITATTLNNNKEQVLKRQRNKTEQMPWASW